MSAEETLCGSVRFARAECTDPFDIRLRVGSSARKERGPQDDRVELGRQTLE